MQGEDPARWHHKTPVTELLLPLESVAEWTGLDTVCVSAIWENPPQRQGEESRRRSPEQAFTFQVEGNRMAGLTLITNTRHLGCECQNELSLRITAL